MQPFKKRPQTLFTMSVRQASLM